MKTNDERELPIMSYNGLTNHATSRCYPEALEELAEMTQAIEEKDEHIGRLRGTVKAMEAELEALAEEIVDLPELNEEIAEQDKDIDRAVESTPGRIITVQECLDRIKDTINNAEDATHRTKTACPSHGNAWIEGVEYGLSSAAELIDGAKDTVEGDVRLTD